MSAQVSSFSGLRAAQAVGLASSGLVAGLALSYPLFFTSHFFPTRSSSAGPNPNFTLHQRLALWSASYARGAKTIPPFAIVAALSYAVTGWLAAPGNLSRQGHLLNAVPAGSGLGRNPLTWYSAAALHLAIVPFTLLVIAPVNSKLADLLRGVGGQSDNPHNAQEKEQEQEAESLLLKWCNLHLIRVASTCAAFAVGISGATF